MGYENAIVGKRFTVERLAGRGGMGVVYRARDGETGDLAALKILHDEAPAAHRERLAREASLLASLTHPAIVRYLAFGATDDGRPYLAMEWLEGEDLAARLRRTGLAVAETVRMVTRIAGALGAAHARGVIHRDIKPSNLFLVDGDPDRIKVLDFGIARVQAADAMTRTGAAIGTPRYMAPEQARGTRDLDASADVFSLGCVLFECLAGRPPFEGGSAMAILAKILLEHSPRLASVRSDLPAALDDLVGRMLAKQPAARPRDGAEVATALDAIGELHHAHARAPSVRDSAVSVGEQRLVCMVFAASAIDVAPGTSASDLSGTSTVVEDVDATATVGDGAVVRALSATVQEHGARSEVLADGSVVVTVFGQGAATDQAARAARCALAIRTVLPHAPMALAIGRCIVGDRAPLGELIDRATILLDGAGHSHDIRVDEVSAGLLDVRFAIGGDDHGLVLAGERDATAPARTLLGKPTACVGRERELGTLAAIFAECVAEPTAHVVVITAAAGVGKSRLRYEFARRIARDAEIWIGRGEPMSAGAPFAMLAQALRRAAGIADNEPVSVRYLKLKARVGRHVPATDAPRITEFLGEFVGAPPPGAGSVQLRAARQDPQLMGDQMLRACEDFIAAECATRPVVLLLDDLQWSDIPTVRFIDAIVRRLPDRPLFVLALARPEVDSLFPGLWAERGATRIPLGELTRRAAEKLVREALGDVDEATVARVVDRAAGNAFYLEELVRSVAEGYGDRLPETVVAMAQARIEGLEPEARHVLRAASIFGQVFWHGGVESLLDGSIAEVGDWLDALAQRELVTERRDSRFAGESEYTFRHSLVREAAYAMLTDRDRMHGHRLAGDWLEARDRAGEVEAVALAEHFLRGGDLRRSIVWYRRAAEQALEGDDLASAIDRAERAIACVRAVGDTGSDGDDQLVGVLRQLQAGAHAWRGEYALAVERGDEALERLAPASAPWLQVAATLAEAYSRRLEHEKLIALCRVLAAIEVPRGVHRYYAHAVAMTMPTLVWHGDKDLLARLFVQLEGIEAEARDHDPATMAWVYSARGWRAMREDDPAAGLMLDMKVEECFTAVGDLRHACQQRAYVGYDQLMLGAFEKAERSLRLAIEVAMRIGLHQVTAQAQHNLGLALACCGRIDEARRIETAALDAFRRQENHRLEIAALNYLALIEIEAANYPTAIQHARAAIEGSNDTPASLCGHYGTLSTAYRLAGNTAAALEQATLAMQMIEAHGRPEEGESSVRLAYAEALHASGDLDGALRAIGDAEARLLDAASKIGDLEWRRSYLEAVADNARTIALARAWRC